MTKWNSKSVILSLKPVSEKTDYHACREAGKHRHQLERGAAFPSTQELSPFVTGARREPISSDFCLLVPARAGVDARFVEDCYPVLPRLIRRFNSHSPASVRLHVLLSFRPSLDLKMGFNCLEFKVFLSVQCNSVAPPLTPLFFLF